MEYKVRYTQQLLNTQFAVLCLVIASDGIIGLYAESVVQRDGIGTLYTELPCSVMALGHCILNNCVM